VRAFLAQTNISLNDLLSLSPGDVITTAQSRATDVVLQVEGQNKFMGQVGQFRGNRAVQVTRKLKSPDEAPSADNKPGEMK
jgi:flagellar motor switch protein FliM